MAHLRDRHLKSTLTRSLSTSPVTAVVGMRQVGKTTLLKGLAKRYDSFDTPELVESFRRRSLHELETGPFPWVLDEIQKNPALFDDIKTVVDKRKTPGRFLLTGSVRFGAKRDIRESLTGRILTYELLPLGLAESHHRRLNPWLKNFVNSPDFTDKHLQRMKDRSWATDTQCDHFLSCGGLPGICFVRDEVLRADRWEQHLDTLLSRDIQLIYKSRLSARKLREMLGILAASQGEPVNQSHLARAAGTTVPTIAAHLKAFEMLFLIRAQGSSYYLEDQGLASHLLRGSHETSLHRMRRLLFSELMQQRAYEFRSLLDLRERRSKWARAFPFVLTFSPRKELVVLIEADDERITRPTQISTTAYLKKKPDAQIVVLHRGAQGEKVHPGLLSIPYRWIF